MATEPDWQFLAEERSKALGPLMGDLTVAVLRNEELIAENKRLRETNKELLAACEQAVGESIAEFIVRACNAREELLAATRALIDWSNHYLPDCPLCGAKGLESGHSDNCPVELAARAIAKAKGG